VDINAFPSMQKRAFLEASASGKQASRKLMHTMLELLLAQYLLYYELHWKYRTRYGDHQLFARLYGSVQKELDSLAEKLIGYHGSDALELIELIDGANDFIKKWTVGNEDFVGQALQAEKTLQNLFHEYYDLLKAKDLLPMGLDDFIMAVCNDHETHTYLLQQVRSGRGKEKTAMPSKANILKALGFTGLGAAAGGVGGYAAGHRTGMARDAETPFSSNHMSFAYRKGQHDVIQALRRQMQSKGSRGKVKKAGAVKSLLIGGGGVAAGGAGGFALGHKKGKSKDMQTPYGAQHMRYAYQKGQQDIVTKLRQRMQAQGKTKKASAVDEILEKLAKDKKGLTAGSAAKMVGIPTGIGATVMGLMAARRGGATPILKNVARGAMGGAAVGTGLAGLIAMGQEIEKADPSGRTLRTMADLAPAVIMAAGAAADLQKKAHVNLKTPDYIMWRRSVIPFPSR